MKKIILSLAILALVGGATFGLTKAYFSDTETNVGNTFTTGTINIDIDGDEEWSQTYSMLDMKPSQTDYINFQVNNTGSNPLNVWKKLYNFSPSDGGAPNEPECLASQGASWNGDSCDGYQAIYNLDEHINYDLSVKVYEQGANSPLWWQTIYADSDNITISEVYASTDRGVLLGMVPAGGYMLVEQSYHLQSEVGNWAQDDSLTFDIQVMGEQLTNEVTMLPKTGSEWNDIDQSSSASVVLKYKVKDKDFKFDLGVAGLVAATDYVVVSGENPYNGSDTVEIASFKTDGSGNYSATEQVTDLNQDLTNAKVWVILASDWSGSAMTAWNGGSYLFETALIDYYDTDL